MKEYVMSVDIAKKRDYYNIQVGRISPEIIPGSAVLGTSDRVVNFLDIVHIEKYQGLTYEDAADKVERLSRHRDLTGNVDIIVDGTGIGDAAVETLRRRNLNPIPIIFTGGTSVREVSTGSARPFSLTPGSAGLGRLAVIEELHVPKNDLVSAGQILMEQHRVRVASTLRWADDFRRQLAGFKGKVNDTTGRRSYNAEDDGVHDDQVVCYLMMAWWMGRLARQTKVKDGTLIRAEERLATGSPYLEAGS